MATYYSYDDIHKIDAWQDNNITLMLTQGEGLDGETGSNTYVKRPTFQLKDQRGIISIPATGARLELAFTRSDRTTGSLGANDIIISDGENGIVSFTVKPNLTSVAGKVKGEIRLITSNAVIKFYGINFWVNKGVSNQDAIESEDFDDLIKAIQELTLITPEGVAILDTLDENGELPTNGTHPVASGVLKEYLRGRYVRSESVNDSAIDNANDQRTIYIHNVGSGVRGRVFFVGHNNYEEVTTVIQYRFCKGGKIEFRTGTVKSPVTTPNTYIWDKTYDEDWNPIGDKGAFVINEETVPESANWDGEIPTTYAGQTGEKGEIAFWNGVLWYLYNVATLGQTTYYHWDKVAVTEDLEAKMDLAPLNPTAEQIAALPAGQLYGDTANHKGTIKDGQEFYDTEYINGNYRKTVYHNYYRPPCVIQSPNAFNIGDTWITHDSRADGSDSRAVSSTDRVYCLLEIKESAYIQGDYIYIWGETTNNAFYLLGNSMISVETVRAVDYGSPLGMCTEDGLLSVGDIVWTKDVNDNITGLFLVTNTYFTYHEIYQCYIKHIESIELSIPYNTYTKNEINNMIGDIGTALDTLNGNLAEV